MARNRCHPARERIDIADLFADPDERKALTDNAAAQFGYAPWIIEKDLWVCWLLARLHDIPEMPVLTFKGGTSLSKVHRLIERFSKDIDLTFSRDGWGFEDDRNPSQTLRQTDRCRS